MRANHTPRGPVQPSSMPLRQLCASTHAGAVVSTNLAWPEFWQQVNDILCSCGYARSTRRQFRHVLRALRQDGLRNPADMTAALAHRFVSALAADDSSWSWIALNISVLRNVFDRICGVAVTEGLVTPKRGFRLPEIISGPEALRLVQAGETIRDQLLLGLLYGCGLTGSEVVRLRWRNVLKQGTQLHIARSTRYRERTLPVPDPLHPVLQVGIEACNPDDYIFRGRQSDTHLSTRMVEVIVRKARNTAQVHRPVCIMTLRHSYAVHRLEHGANPRQVQEELGLRSIRTMERYQRCIAPKLHQHPITEVRRRMPASASSASFCSEMSTAPATLHSPAPQSTVYSPQSTLQRPLSALRSIDLSNLQLPFPSQNKEPSDAAFLRLMKNRLIGRLFRRPRAP